MSNIQKTPSQSTQITQALTGTDKEKTDTSLNIDTTTLVTDPLTETGDESLDASLFNIGESGRLLWPKEPKGKEKGGDAHPPPQSPEQTTAPNADNNVDSLLKKIAEEEEQRLSARLRDQLRLHGLSNLQHGVLKGTGTSRASSGLSTSRSGHVATSLVRKNTEDFRGIRDLDYSAFDFDASRSDAAGIDIDQAKRILAQFASEIGADFQQLVLELLRYTIVNGTSPYIDSERKFLVKIDEGAYLSVKHGEFITYLQIKAPGITLRQFMGLFADNARKLLENNPQLIPPSYKKALATHQSLPSSWRVISFDYASDCTGLTQLQQQYVNLLKQRSLFDSGSSGVRPITVKFKGDQS